MAWTEITLLSNLFINNIFGTGLLAATGLTIILAFLAIRARFPMVEFGVVVLFPLIITLGYVGAVERWIAALALFLLAGAIGVRGYMGGMNS